MKRCALIVGASPQRKELASLIQDDLNLWVDFLSSVNGGAWISDKEIVQLINPRIDEIRRELASMKDAEYSIVVFSGRGEVVVDEFGFSYDQMILGDGESISERELNPKGRRCVLFLDCGRLGVDEGRSGLPRRSFEENGSGKRNLFREIYKTSVLECEEGFVKVRAADIGCSASDDNSFSKTILDYSLLKSVCGEKVLTVHDAVDGVRNAFIEKKRSGLPSYNGGRRCHHFPFSINMDL